jgi:hypothetical protein
MWVYFAAGCTRVLPTLVRKALICREEETYLRQGIVSARCRTRHLDQPGIGLTQPYRHQHLVCQPGSTSPCRVMIYCLRLNHQPSSGKISTSNHNCCSCKKLTSLGNTPGAMQFTRTLVCANVVASMRVKCVAAALELAYAN